MNKIETLWQEILNDSAQLEVFEPKLSGFSEQLQNIANGQKTSNNWLTNAEPFLNGELVSEIASKLNQIAGIHFSQNEMNEAKHISMKAIVLYQIALGPEHPDTIRAIENNKKIPNPIKSSSTTLPRLWNFKRKTR